jgi:hypothetical protein
VARNRVEGEKVQFECESFTWVTSMDSSKFSMRKTKVGPMIYARLKDKCELKGNSIVAKKDYLEANFHILSIILQKRNILSLLLF